MAKEISENTCYVALTEDYLDAKSMMDKVRSPKAGAIVLFAGNFYLYIPRNSACANQLPKALRVITLPGSPSKSFNIPPMSHVPSRACLRYASLSKRSMLSQPFQ